MHETKEFQEKLKKELIKYQSNRADIFKRFD